MCVGCNRRQIYICWNRYTRDVCIYMTQDNHKCEEVYSLVGYLMMEWVITADYPYLPQITGRQITGNYRKLPEGKLPGNYREIPQITGKQITG